MPGTPTPGRMAIPADLADMQRQIRSLASQQTQVITDPTGATGDPDHGHATVVIGVLQPITGIAAFGVAMWSGTAWVQITSAVEAWRLVGNAGQPALVNSWVASASTRIGFYKDPQGLVHLKGRLAGGGSGITAFTLPAGYRPGQPDTYSGAVYNGTTAIAGLTFIDVTGSVQPYYAAGAVDIGLGGITFRAEN